MCGIIGYLGPKNPKDVIVSGLKKLEYRGYDSAGVAIIHEGKAKQVRAPGKLVALEQCLASEKFDGHAGIGHTRWATHGIPSERNAHPHMVEGISLVHNGIIENYIEIREQLLRKGANVLSDTDSELVAHLIANAIQKTKNLRLAVMEVLKEIRGAFSIVVMWDQAPDCLVAFKDGPPLVVGLGDQGQLENFVASDVQGVLEYTKKFIYLDDREVVEIYKDRVEVFSAQGSKLHKPVTVINWNPDMIEKAGYRHFMLKEIYEQPRAVAAALEPYLDIKTHKISIKNWGISDEEVRQIEKIVIVACGTSSYAGLVGKYLLEQISKLPVEVDIASEYRYREPIINKNTLVVTISQSGETADTLAAIRLAKEMGAKTLSICNVKGSSIDREAHGHLFMNAGPEIGVASTKAFTATMMVLNCLAIHFGSVLKTLKDDQEEELVQALLMVPSQMEVVLSYDKYFDQAASELNSFKGFLYMGRGVNFPIAMEGALKLKELAYLHAEGYAAGEMKHGPLALVDEKMVTIMIAPNDRLYEKTISNLEEVRARRGKVISIGTGDNLRLKEISEFYLSLPRAHWVANPFLAVIPLQLMSYHLACHLGHDVDQPRNLAKSVTVE